MIVSLKTGSSNYFLAFSIPAAVCIVAGGVMIRNDLLTGESRLLLPGGERTIKAEVLGITRNLRTAGEKTTYYVICKYKDPVTGREETFTATGEVQKFDGFLKIYKASDNGESENVMTLLPELKKGYAITYNTTGCLIK